MAIVGMLLSVMSRTVCGRNLLLRVRVQNIYNCQNCLVNIS